MVGSEVLMAVCCHNPCVGVFNGGIGNGQTDGMTSNFMAGGWEGNWMALAAAVPFEIDAWPCVRADAR